MRSTIVVQQKGGERVTYQLASSRRLPVPERTLREWVKRGEVRGLVRGRLVYLAADEKLTARLQTWRDSMNAMVEAQQGAPAKHKARMMGRSPR